MAVMPLSYSLPYYKCF